MARLAIIDYGMGNLRSVQKAFEYIGVDAAVTDDPQAILRADGAVLPGVGAFCDCMQNLGNAGLLDATKEVAASGRPFLGICLGLQLLFERSQEGGSFGGLGILPGEVVALPPGRKIPHMGWNNLTVLQRSPLFIGLPEDAYVYFVHSYYAVPADRSLLSATTDYGVKVTAAVQRGNLFATQFHPEKSGEVGLMILRNFGGLL